MATKKIRKVLPAGVAVFPALRKVEEYQPVDDKGRPQGEKKRHFKVLVRYDEATREEVKKMLVEAAVKQGADEDVKLPFKKIKVKNDKGEVIGKELLLEAKSGEKYPPAIFDRKVQSVPLSVDVGGGSKIKLDVAINYYTGFGGGVNLYLYGVQVLELVEKTSQKTAFAAEDEGYEAPEESEQATAFTATGGDEDALSL